VPVECHTGPAKSFPGRGTSFPFFPGYIGASRKLDAVVRQPAIRVGDQLKTAQALGIVLPPALLATADEVIE
jgi:hypothetical protein